MTTIQQGALVRLEYSVFDATGELFESSEEHGPVETVVGSGELPPGVESALEGRAEGDELQVSLEPADAYGEFDPGRLETVPRENFPPDEELSLGELIEVELEAEEGEDEEDVPDEPLVARVVELSPEGVVLDFNHPLAGQKVDIRVKVLSIEED